MHFNKCFEGVSGKILIFHNGKNPIEVFFPLEDGISFAYSQGPTPTVLQEAAMTVINNTECGRAPTFAEIKG